MIAIHGEGLELGEALMCPEEFLADAHPGPHGLRDAVVATLAACPADARRAAVEALLVCGGGCAIPGEDTHAMSLCFYSIIEIVFL